MFTTKTRADLIRLGSEYGGWVIPASLANEKSICYCAGVGEDITFDLALIERFGCTVHAFDPTPEAHAHVESLEHLPDKFKYHRFGVWSEDTTLKFFAPRNPEADISHSALNLGGTEKYFEGQVRSIRSIMSELGQDQIDLLKLDIEGAEHAVLNHLECEAIWPHVLCIEFDQPCAISTIRRRIQMLASHEYSVVATERWNFTFVRDSVAAAR